ncbi:GH92 family glycosyl hydrolase [Sandaracinus amylolyticus]|uniref:GH92 family glycosyl hydrolase n=1 Tax=Sandaracinus amylolyticus TaxID=927083 RepID=UPI001F291931|nr:GH92 family glycosyl hydrolase [Sandaracinus amylolyticus]
MTREALTWALLLGLCGSLSACGDSDASSPDAGPADSGPVDAGPPPPSRPAATPLLQWVDPFIGTGGVGFNDIGSTYPGPAMPFGMIHPGPDTMNETGALVFTHCSGYAYGDRYIRAFSHTRMNGVGITDYGAVALMPTVGMSAERTTVLGHRSSYDKESEVASPGYYAVTLDEGDIHVELTSGLRAALHRYTFEAGSDATVLLDVAHALPEVRVDDGAITVLPETREFEGFVHFSGGYSDRFGGVRVYYVARFDRDFAAHGVWQAGALHEGETTRSGADVGGWARFDASSERVVNVAVGISFLDVARARANLEAEAADLDFDRMRAAAESEWESQLARVELEGRDDRDFRIFYTALYHALLMPTLATESDGRYRGLDGEEHVADGFTYYTDLSLWDTYRTFHPWATLLWRDRARDFAKSMIAMAEQHGSYPRWPLGTGETGGMLGDPAVIVLADTWQRGVRDWDVARAYELARVSADGDPPSGGRGVMEPYLRLGFVPIERAGASASKTMEYAYADDAVATLARAAGDDERAATYEARGRNYQNLWDPERELFIGRHEDGSWPDEVNERRWEDFYAEGNAWQYLWLAPHDVDGLAETMGGRDRMIERLAFFFEQSEAERRTIGPPAWYWHGNEPDLHAPYLFAALGDHARSARWAAWARRTFYGDTPEGLPGNDDGGTMSAWYLFASLGLYPMAGDDDFVLGTPLWTRAVVHLEGGDLVIEAPEASAHAVYARSMSWNGTTVEGTRIEHADIAAGGTLSFEMSASPE